MFSKFPLLPRIATVAGVLAVAAVPALAQTAQPGTSAVPGATAPAAQPAEGKAAEKHAVKKGKETHHKAGIRRHNERTARAPHAKKGEDAAKTDTAKQKL